jgi:hypothetical protein
MNGHQTFSKRLYRSSHGKMNIVVLGSGSGCVLGSRWWQTSTNNKKKPPTRGANDADPRVDPLIGCIIMDLIYRRLLLNDYWDQGDAGHALMERLTHRVQERHRQFRTSMTQEQANEQISLCLGHPLSSLSVLEIVDKVSAHNLHRTSEIERYKRLIESHQQAIRELEAEKALAADSARPAPTRSRAALGRRPRRNQAPQAGGGGDLEK